MYYMDTRPSAMYSMLETQIAIEHIFHILVTTLPPMGMIILKLFHEYGQQRFIFNCLVLLN